MLVRDSALIMSLWHVIVGYNPPEPLLLCQAQQDASQGGSLGLLNKTMKPKLNKMCVKEYFGGSEVCNIPVIIRRCTIRFGATQARIQAFWRG